MNHEVRNEYARRRLEALGIAESIAMRLRKLDAVPGVNWGHIGDMAAMCHDLRQIEDRVYGTGEYAPDNVARAAK
jgi:hypothetical protein